MAASQEKIEFQVKNILHFSHRSWSHNNQNVGFQEATSSETNSKCCYQKFELVPIDGEVRVSV